MRLDINYRGKKKAKNTNSWRLNNTLLNNKEITEEIRKEIKRFLETSDNENMTIQNLWDSAKAVLRRKFIVIQSYLKKQETLNRQPNSTSKSAGKKNNNNNQKNPQSQQNEEDHKNKSRNK